MAKKKTSTRLAKIAGKYAAMDGNTFWLTETHGSVEAWDALFRNVKALAASVLSQTEKPEPKKAKVRK